MPSTSVAEIMPRGHVSQLAVPSWEENTPCPHVLHAVGSW